MSNANCQSAILKVNKVNSCRFGKYVYLLFIQGLKDKININLMYLC